MILRSYTKRFQTEASLGKDKDKSGPNNQAYGGSTAVLRPTLFVPHNHLRPTRNITSSYRQERSAKWSFQVSEPTKMPARRPIWGRLDKTIELL
jgi:hypothetical protein